MYHDRLYNTADDCLWLRDTALKGYTLPVFNSFTIAGNEDCPLEIRLYEYPDPLNTEDPIRSFALWTDPVSNLGRYLDASEAVPAGFYRA